MVAVASADWEGGGEGGEEEQYTATGRNQRHGIYRSTLNTLEVHILVS